MKLVTKEFTEALIKLKKTLGTNRNIAQKCGVSEVHIARLLSGKTEIIKDDTFAKLLPLLIPHLKDSMRKNEKTGEYISAYRPTCDLSDMEKLLLKYFRRLTDEQKLELLLQIKILAQSHPAG
jgi:transcriptional regulator with XRE-family HTH domain